MNIRAAAIVLVTAPWACGGGDHSAQNDAMDASGFMGDSSNGGTGDEAEGGNLPSEAGSRAPDATGDAQLADGALLGALVDGASVDGGAADSFAEGSVLLGPFDAAGACDIRTYGAVGDGKAKDTAALQNAIDKCSVVLVPAGTYLIGPITLRSNVTLELDPGATLLGSANWSDYPAASSGNLVSLFNGSNLSNVSIIGQGTIDGNGASFWAVIEQQKASGQALSLRPQLFEISKSAHLLFAGFTAKNSPNVHFAIQASTYVTFQSVVIDAPVDSPNTDGIDPKSCTHVVVKDSRIATGDDNVAVDSDLNAPSTDLTFTGDTIGHGHGLSIGSFTAGSVSGLVVDHCTFQDTAAGIRIKTARDRGGLVENLTYSNIQMINVAQPIFLSEYYPDATIPPAGSDHGQSITATTPLFRNIQVSNMTATTDASGCQGARGVATPCLAGQMIGLPESAISNVTFSNVRIQAATGLVVRNASVAATGSTIAVTSPPSVILEENAHATGL